MEGRNVAASGIVREVLTRYNNYEEWATLVKSYLIGKNLWDVVVERCSASTELEARRMNGEALHIILVTCGSKIFDEIKHFETAASAWNYLSARYDSFSKSQALPNIQQGLVEDRFHASGPLFKYAEEGDWKSVLRFLDNDMNAVSSVSGSGRTILHIATVAGNVDMVEKLTDLGGKRLVGMQDWNGYTALALAAHYTGDVVIAKRMVERGSKELLGTRNDNGEIPLLLAAAMGYKDMTRYLYSKTPHDVLSGQDSDVRVLLLERCIKAEIFDVALSILDSNMPWHNESFGPLHKLAQMPSAFFSGSNFRFPEQFVYSMLRVENNNQNRFKSASTAILPDERRHKKNFLGSCCCSVMNLLLLPLKLLGWVLAEIVCLFLQLFKVLNIFGIRKIYEKKRTHYQVLQILLYFTLGVEGSNDSELHRAMLDAARYGIVEFINVMTKANPDLLWAMDSRGRSVFSYAVLHRKKNVFQLIHSLNLKKNIMIDRSTDMFGNNLLHLAGHLGQFSDINLRPGAALQMQREIQWFKAVEELVHPKYKEEKNEDDKKPHELFTETHEELVKEGEKWAKDSAASFTIVGTLIATISFAAAFTVPGGNNQETGVPILLNETIFIIFVVADAISLFTSATSVLIFMEVQTSRFTEIDFLKSLPLKILFGYFFLFVSVVSVIVVFCAALALVIHKYTAYKLLFICGAFFGSIPLIVLVPSQLRLMYEIFRSTISNPITV